MAINWNPEKQQIKKASDRYTEHTWKGKRLSIEDFEMMDMLIKGLIAQYLDQEHISIKEYAKRVDISAVTAAGLYRSIIPISTVDFNTVLRILMFHGYYVDIVISKPAG